MAVEERERRETLFANEYEPVCHVIRSMGYDASMIVHRGLVSSHGTPIAIFAIMGTTLKCTDNYVLMSGFARHVLEARNVAAHVNNETGMRVVFEV